MSRIGGLEEEELEKEALITGNNSDTTYKWQLGGSGPRRSALMLGTATEQWLVGWFSLQPASRQQLSAAQQLQQQQQQQ